MPLWRLHGRCCQPCCVACAQADPAGQRSCVIAKLLCACPPPCRTGARPSLGSPCPKSGEQVFFEDQYPALGHLFIRCRAFQTILSGFHGIRCTPRVVCAWHLPTNWPSRATHIPTFRCRLWPLAAKLIFRRLFALGQLGALQPFFKVGSILFSIHRALRSHFDYSRRMRGTRKFAAEWRGTGSDGHASSSLDSRCDAWYGLLRLGDSGR